MNDKSRANDLLSPLEIMGMEFPNRVVMAPMTRARAGKQRVPNNLMSEYYAQRSSAGLIVTEATTISEQANGWNESPGIYSQAMMEGWKQVVAAVHAKKGRIFLQLWHCGRASHSDFHSGERAVAPSAIPINGDYIHTPNGKKPHETPRALDTDEISFIIDDYRKAAEKARQAGFDGIEIHAANGYLLDEFLQSKTNLRNDSYGGNITNRFRLLGEVLDAVTTVWPSHRVGVRLSPNGVYNDMGSPDYREQFLYVAEQLDQCSLAYLHVMDGLGFGFHDLGTPMTLAEFRSVYQGPMIGNCGYTREAADTEIRAGNADMIAFGRPYISNPDLVERFANNWPLAEQADMSVWYSPSGSKGYTDFPSYTPDNKPA